MLRTEKEINLISSRKKIKYGNSPVLLAAFAGVILMVLIVLLTYLLPEIRLSRLKAENNQLVQKIGSIGDLDEEVKKYESKQAQLQKINEAYETIKKEKVSVLEFLSKLSANIPENVFISSLSLTNGDTLSVSFITTNPVDTAKLIVKLRQMDLFENIDVDSVPITEGENSINFTLKIKGKNPPVQNPNAQNAQPQQNQPEQGKNGGGQQKTKIPKPGDQNVNEQ